MGRVEYRHLHSQAGGAQYVLAATQEQDVLVVFADAFARDADPDDFSLEAIIAHERGHQIAARHPRLVRNLPATWSSAAEEIVASLVGSLMVRDEKDKQDLLAKALFEADRPNRDPARTTELILELRVFLEKTL